MAGPRTLGLLVLMTAALTAGAANAQSLQRSEVLGTWTLTMTPAEGGDASITIQTDTGRLEMPLIVSPRGPSGITCTADGEAADCQLRRGQLVVTLTMDDARMAFTLASRTPSGFSGTARLRLPLLPFGSVHLGTVAMTRR